MYDAPFIQRGPPMRAIKGATGRGKGKGQVQRTVPDSCAYKIHKLHASWNGARALREATFQICGVSLAPFLVCVKR